MPTLHWIGKEKVVNHHQDVPYRVLEHKYGFTAEKGEQEQATGSGNKIIHGDNLEALKSLLPEYEGKIKCIYIDPPYNTGNEDWVYNDNVNHPKIKKWLGEVVGKEGDDLTRHDKWLCMMYPRLKLLSKLLNKNGALIISISYHEVSNLMLLCKEIFSRKQFVCVTVQTSGGKPSGGFNYLHEYLVFVVPKDFSSKPLSHFGGNSRSPFEGLTLATFTKVQRPNQAYPIFIDADNGRLVGIGDSLQERINKGTYTKELDEFVYDYQEAPAGTVAIWPITSKGKECVWRLISSRLLSDWEKGYVKITENKSTKILNKYSIQYLPSGVIKKIESGELEIIGKGDEIPTLIFGENKTVGGQIPTIWTQKSFFTVNGTSLLNNIFKEKKFDYPKSLELVSEVIRAICSKEDIVLDSFAGSGSLAHGVLKLNKEDSGNRKFIIVEMENYANEVTAERIKRSIDGYQYKGNAKEQLFSKKITFNSLKNGLKIVETINTLKDTHKEKYDGFSTKIEDKQITLFGEKKEIVKIEGTGGSFDYYELGEPLFLENGFLNEEVELEKIEEYVWYSETKSSFTQQEESYLLGKQDDTAYYFYYEKEGLTTLNESFLRKIKTKAEQYIVYADNCLLDKALMEKYNIIFKKIPRDITRF